MTSAFGTRELFASRRPREVIVSREVGHHGHVILNANVAADAPWIVMARRADLDYADTILAQTNKTRQSGLCPALVAEYKLQIKADESQKPHDQDLNL